MTDHPTPVPLGEEDMAALRGYIEAHPDTFAWHVRLDSILATIDSLTARLAAVEAEKEAYGHKWVNACDQAHNHEREKEAAEARVRQLEEALRDTLESEHIRHSQGAALLPYGPRMTDCPYPTCRKYLPLLSPPVPAAPEEKP